MRATRAVINLNILKDNLKAIKRYIGPTVSIALSIKANAYGHGAVAVAKTAEALGITTFGVSNTDEAVELRNAGIASRILLYSLPLSEEIPVLVNEGIECFVGDEKLIILFSSEARRQNTISVLHLKVDTGMGRIGCSPENLPTLAEEVSKNKNLKLGGICTHFPASGSTDSNFTKKQIKIFNYWVGKVRDKGILPGVLHAANSDALLTVPESLMDMVRPGLLVYGYYPDGIADSVKKKVPVKPVMEFKTKVVFLKRVKAGTPISYGMTYKTKRETVITTLAAGYGDGYNRLLSNRGKVLIRGKLYPIVGRICMDQCMADLGPRSDVKLYDDAILFGRKGSGKTENPLDANDIAQMIKTIPYEVTLLITKRVPRVYIV
ncbi:MAG: alanine racemase [Spirochaetales bacterium]|nr:alanine racemase [Spirochaetales bacterium]